MAHNTNCAPFYVMEREKVIIACAAVFVIQLCLLLRSRKVIHRRWWVRPTDQSRNTHGFQLTRFRELKVSNQEEFYLYTRMFPHIFDRLLNLVRPVLLKNVSRGRRRPLDPELKLALTLS